LRKMAIFLQEIVISPSPLVATVYVAGACPALSKLLYHKGLRTLLGMGKTQP
jgi:hypothetical protein